MACRRLGLTCQQKQNEAPGSLSAQTLHPPMEKVSLKCQARRSGHGQPSLPIPDPLTSFWTWLSSRKPQLHWVVPWCNGLDFQLLSPLLADAPACSIRVRGWLRNCLDKGMGPPVFFGFSGCQHLPLGCWWVLAASRDWSFFLCVWLHFFSHLEIRNNPKEGGIVHNHKSFWCTDISPLPYFTFCCSEKEWKS